VQCICVWHCIIGCIVNLSARDLSDMAVDGLLDVFGTERRSGERWVEGEGLVRAGPYSEAPRLGRVVNKLHAQF